jgi:hypothetical protein
MLALFLSACSTWRPIPVSPREFIEQERPSHVRVTRPDGATEVLQDPSIQNDSIVAKTQHWWGRSRDPQPILPLTEVTRLEVLRADAGRTLLTILAVPAVIFAVAWIAVESQGGLFGN